MTTLLILYCILVSVLGLAYMTATDPKRRRGAKLAQYQRRPLLWPARIALFGPGIALTAMGHWAGLSLWGGAITLIGWVIAAISPATYGHAHADIQARLIDLGDQTKGYVKAGVMQMIAPLYRIPMPKLLTGMNERLQSKTEKAPVGDRRLEARLIALEARLHRLERENEQLREGITPDPMETVSTASRT